MKIPQQTGTFKPQLLINYSSTILQLFFIIPHSHFMVTISINYAGELRCNSTHDPSDSKLSTDAPIDNNGKGETFSPTDLVATALGSCMATIMGIVAERKKISLKGMTLKVEKHMSEDTPRRIARLPVTIHMPMAENHKYKELMINAALTCPVHQSLHPSIEVPIDWVWQ